MRTSYYFFCFIINILFFPAAAHAQTINFDETWKEFLENDKISNMSQLVRPHKVYDQPDYAKYLLMNTNSDFCQSDVEEAESLMAEIRELDPEVLESIQGFVEKMEALQAKIDAYHTMDAIWSRFLQIKQVSSEELEAVTAAKTSCEKGTLAKYSYMTAHLHLCRGDVAKAKDVFENRTLKLIEKTSLRIEDVEGLAAEAAKMKAMFKGMAQLDVVWNSFVKTGVSPGFDLEMPLFPCYPIPNMKALILNGVVDVCNAGPANLEKIRALQADSGVEPDKDLAAKVKELEASIATNDQNLATLNEAWEAFIPNNEAKLYGTYGYDYCTTEPLIRAYIMDGFAYTCELAEEMLRRIDSLNRAEPIDLDEITLVKIGELAALTEQYQANAVKVEKTWRKFIAQGDKLRQDYPTTDLYCDNIHQVKDWTMQGLSGDCEAGYLYLDQIEAFQRTFEFDFLEDLECRVQNLRVKVWDCRYQLLDELARVEAPDAYEARLEELMEEYGMGERPEVCSLKE